MIERVSRSAVVVAGCAVVWLLLHGELNVVNAVWGVVLGAGLVAVFPVDLTARRHRVHPWHAFRWVTFVLWSLLRSSWAVIKVIVRPTPVNLRAGIVRIELASDSALTTTLVANAITLTPGTMTLTATTDPAELHVHGIGIGDPDEFRRTVRDLERRTLSAVRPQPVERNGDAS